MAKILQFQQRQRRVNVPVSDLVRAAGVLPPNYRETIDGIARLAERALRTRRPYDLLVAGAAVALLLDQLRRR